jgi:hypothetical protein
MSDESSEHNKKNTKGEYNFMENVGVALAASPIGQSPIGDAVRKVHGMITGGHDQDHSDKSPSQGGSKQKSQGLDRDH